MQNAATKTAKPGLKIVKLNSEFLKLTKEPVVFGLLTCGQKSGFVIHTLFS